MASRPSRLRLSLVAVVVLAPLAVASGVAAGCNGGGSGKGAAAPSGSPSPATSPAPSPAIADAARPPDAVGPAVDAAPEASLWPVGVDAAVASTDAAPAGPCWKGFTPTGNPEADVAELGNRCAQGMSPLVPPVKHTFKAGESKTVPVPIVPGCYRVIAVGGKGVKDVDLALKDASGKIVAADMTPDDVFPMIHPNKEFCAEAVQFLNLVITVKKGSGDVAGGVWKR